MRIFVVSLFFFLLAGCEAIPQEDQLASNNSLTESNGGATGTFISIGNSSSIPATSDAFTNLVAALRTEYLDKIQYTLGSLYISTGEDSTGAKSVCYVGENLSILKIGNKAVGEITNEELERAFKSITSKVIDCIDENADKMADVDFAEFERSLNYAFDRNEIAACTSDSQCSILFARNGCGASVISSMVHGNEAASFYMKASLLLDEVARKEDVSRIACAMVRQDFIPKCVKNVCVNPNVSFYPN